LIGITNMYVKACLFSDDLPADHEETILHMFLKGVGA